MLLRLLPTPVTRAGEAGGEEKEKAGEGEKEKEEAQEEKGLTRWACRCVRMTCALRQCGQTWSIQLSLQERGEYPDVGMMGHSAMFAPMMGMMRPALLV